MPALPNVGVADKPRGWLSVPEYELFISKPKKLGRVRVGWSKEALIGEPYFCMPGKARCADDKLCAGCI